MADAVVCEAAVIAEVTAGESAARASGEAAADVSTAKAAAAKVAAASAEMATATAAMAASATTGESISLDRGQSQGDNRQDDFEFAQHLVLLIRTQPPHPSRFAPLFDDRLDPYVRIPPQPRFVSDCSVCPELAATLLRLC